MQITYICVSNIEREKVLGEYTSSSKYCMECSSIVYFKYKHSKKK